MLCRFQHVFESNKQKTKKTIISVFELKELLSPKTSGQKIDKTSAKHSDIFNYIEFFQFYGIVLSIQQENHFHLCHNQFVNRDS